MTRQRNAALGRLAIRAIALLLLSSTVANGSTYYVRADGNDASDGLTNTAEGAWRTIDWAAGHVIAGDVVRVQDGTYVERVTPRTSGAAGTPITFVADGSVTFCGMTVSSKDYLRIIGFTMDAAVSGCPTASRVVNLAGTNVGLEFWNNIVRGATSGIGTGSYADRHQNFIVIGNLFTGIGPGGPGVSLRGNNSFLAYNEFDKPNPDAFLVDGNNNRWLNNYTHQPSDAAGHSDVFQSNSSSLGLGYNLFESNFAVGTGTLADEHGALFQNQSVAYCSTGTCGPVTENLFRRNVWHNISGTALSADSSAMGAITNTRQVHDSVIEVVRTQPAYAYGVLFRDSATAYLFNNLNYQAWGTSKTTNVQVFSADTGASISGAGYNLAYSPAGAVTFAMPWTTQSNQLSNVDPSLVDRANDNFALQAWSSARGAAGALTVVRGGGSGTRFTVAAGGGGFFRAPDSNVAQYGGNLTSGDVITVGTTTRTIASISGDAITVTSSFSWADGDPVFLGASATPDIGAFPYISGGYNLSAKYAVSNGVATVTPSDANLVRFVICYEDGIPTAVDNASPYSCSVGSGSLEVRVYPRYASKTLFVSASESATPPANLRLVAD